LPRNALIRTMTKWIFIGAASIAWIVPSGGTVYADSGTGNTANSAVQGSLQDNSPQNSTSTSGLGAQSNLGTSPQTATSTAFSIDNNAIAINQSTVDGVPLVNVQGANPPQIVSQAAVVMDMSTGTVVYEKNPLAPHYPASLTKILTALVALDKGSLSDELTVSKTAADQPPDKLYLIPGEQATLQQFLNGLLIDSANDAAVVIAQHYGGNVQGFAQMMNATAASLGATHTHFVNPNGLPNPNHVTTAYDLALISRAALENPTFRQIVSTKFYNWKGQAWHSRLMNINPLLFTYPGAIGIKTGYTSVAHETLAVAATRGNETFLAILLDAPLTSQIDSDATNLLNYAFSNYTTETILPQGTQVGTYTLSNGQAVPVTASREIVATVEKGQKLNFQRKIVFHDGARASGGTDSPVGQLELLQNGQVTATEPVLANVPSEQMVQVGNNHVRWGMSATILMFVLVLVALLMRRRYVRRKPQPYRVGDNPTWKSRH